MGDRLKAARRVEAGGEFVGERLVVNKAVCVGRADGLFVEALGVERAALEAGDLRADQRGAVLEILRAVRGPHLELAVVREPDSARCCGHGPPLERRRRQRGTARHRNGIRPVSKKCRDVQSSRSAFIEASTAAVSSPARVARLQLAHPIPARGKCQARIP